MRAPSAGLVLSETPCAKVAPFALLRIAGLPVARVTALAPPRTVADVDRILIERAAMERTRPLVEAALHAVVPTLTDAKLRGIALRLARDVHNSRPVAHVDSVLPCLPPHAQTALRDWTDSQARAADWLDAADEALGDEVATHLRPQLRTLAEDELFAGALALAAPPLLNTIARGLRASDDGVRATKPEKSLLRYAFRAAVKTSPFSTFTHVTMLDVLLDSQSHTRITTGQSRVERTASVNRGIVARLRRTATATVPEHDRFRFRINPTARLLGTGTVGALASTYVMLLGRPWRQERVARFRFHSAVAQAIAGAAGECVAWADVVRLVARAGVNEDDARHFVAKLFDRGLVWVEPFTDGFDPDPASRFREELNGASSAAVRQCAGIVERMASTAAVFRDADASTRLVCLDRVRQLEAEGFRAMGVEPPECYRNVVLENSWISGASGAVGADAAAAVKDLAAFLSTEVALRPEYARLQDAFIRRYGASGTCRDVVGFLMSVAHQLTPATEPGVTRPAEAWAPPMPPLGGTGTGVTAYVQVVPGTNAESTDGPVSLVVNRVFEGVGWLSARFAMGPGPEPERLRTLLRGWLTQAFAPREPLDLMMAGECNDLQVHPRVTNRVLGWPGEPLLSDPAGVVPAQELILHHNPDTGALDLSDSIGTPVALAYLGSVFPSPTWGVPYALAVLAQPHYIQRPDFSPRSDSTADIEFQPRRTYGRLILTRSTWWIRAGQLRTLLRARAGAGRLVDMGEFCRRHRLPSVFFAQAFTSPAAGGLEVPLDVRKPLGIDSRNPFCLDLLERVTERAEWVIVTEPLPRFDQLWVELNGTPRASELQIEMMLPPVRRDPVTMSEAVVEAGP